MFGVVEGSRPRHLPRVLFRLVSVVWNHWLLLCLCCCSRNCSVTAVQSSVRVSMTEQPLARYRSSGGGGGGGCCCFHLYRPPRRRRRSRSLGNGLLWIDTAFWKLPSRHGRHPIRRSRRFQAGLDFESSAASPLSSFQSSSSPASYPPSSEPQLGSATPPPLLSQPPGGLFLHHAAIKTRNITTAIDFYSLLGFRVACRFRAGPARAAWLELNSTTTTSGRRRNLLSSRAQSSSPTTVPEGDEEEEETTKNSARSGGGCRLELLEVPAYVLRESPGTRRRALDLMQQQDVLGYNHVALDVTAQIRQPGGSGNSTAAAAADAAVVVPPSSLSEWLRHLNATSWQRFGKTLRVALQPRQQMIGRSVYELAFVYDADGALVELLNHQSELKQTQAIESGWEPWNGTGFVGPTGN